MGCQKEASVKTQEEIVQALEGLPPTVLEQVRDFVVFLRETKEARSSSSSGKELARRQTAAIKKWAGTELGPGFTGKDHDEMLYGSKG
jgi:hypothetical protein